MSGIWAVLPHMHFLAELRLRTYLGNSSEDKTPARKGMIADALSLWEHVYEAGFQLRQDVFKRVQSHVLLALLQSLKRGLR